MKYISSKTHVIEIFKNETTFTRYFQICTDIHYKSVAVFQSQKQYEIYTEIQKIISVPLTKFHVIWTSATPLSNVQFWPLRSVTKQGYLKCSIQDTINLFHRIFHKFVWLELCDVKFLFSKKMWFSQGDQNNCYGCTSLVLIIWCTQEIYDLFKTW